MAAKRWFSRTVTFRCGRLRAGCLCTADYAPGLLCTGTFRRQIFMHLDFSAIEVKNFFFQNVFFEKIFQIFKKKKILFQKQVFSPKKFISEKYFFFEKKIFV